MNIRCLVIDDDTVFQEILRQFIEKTDYLTLVNIFDNPIQAANFLEENEVDLIFLDIEMPEMSGLEFLKTLPSPPQIILISSKKEYALDAYEFDVADYILKPLKNYSRFLTAVNKVKKKLKSNYDYFFIKEDSRLIKIKLTDIYYVEAYGDYVKIYLKDRYRMILSPLKIVLDKLPGNDFMQVHRSYIVRLDKIEELEGNMIRMNGTTIPISRSLREDILKRIKTF